MKILAILSLLAVTCQLINAVYLKDLKADLVRGIAFDSINDKFKALLEKLKVIIKSGNDTLGIPVLDPFHLAHQEFDMTDNIYTGKAEVKNFEFEGLSNYIVKDADFKIAKWNVTVDFLWPSIKGKTEYDLNGHLLKKILIFGNGDLSYEISDFHFSTQIKLKLNFKTKKVSVSFLNATSISIKDIKVIITGLFYDDDISKLASAVISDILPDSIAEFQEEITKNVNEMLKKNANILLDKFSLDDITSIIN